MLITNSITPKLVSSYIDENVNNKFLEIFNKHCNGNKPVTSKSFKFSEKDNIEKDFEPIINIASNLLCYNDFNINTNHGFVELWKYEASGSKVCGPLAIHIDDYGAVNFPVETCIFYLNKDDGVIGGNLRYNENIEKQSCFGMFSRNLKCLDISSQMVVLLNGNLEHIPEDISGFGSRKCIVVQFRSFDRN